MKSATLENSRVTEPAPPMRHLLAPTERPLTVDQLAQAVGEHALRQAEIDQTMAERIIELRNELNTAKDEIRSLRAQIEQLVQGLSQGLAFAHQQSASGTKSALQASLASLRSR